MFNDPYFRYRMKGFINIHSHSPGANTIVDLYEDFEQAVNIPSCSTGLHPWYLDSAEQGLELLGAVAHLKNVVAIGECGLDKACATDLLLQQHYFQQQIVLANKVGKPLIIHCVRAFSECISMLGKAEVPVIFHGFNRNEHIAQMILDKGYYLSIGAAVLGQGFATVFKSLPLDRIFFETDDNEEQDIEAIYKRAADLQNIAVESLILQVEDNFQKVFNNAR